MAAVASPPPALPSADAVMGRAAAENFTVASRILPREARDQLLAIYGFARLVDDVGDEYDGDRPAALDELEAQLDLAFDGGEPPHPVMRALAAALRTAGLPREPFAALIEANRRDQVVCRYETFDELVDYCRLSADPVGRLVLCAFGLGTRDRFALSDAICTGLQLVEHWQDVGEDFARGRIYVPLEDLEHFGCEPEDLGRRPASPPVRRLVAFEAARAYELLVGGAPLVRMLPARPALAVAGFVSGGLAALRAIERADHDVLGEPPRARTRERAASLVSALAWAVSGA